MGLILMLILVLLLMAALPTWPYSRSWGYGPSGLAVVLLVVLLVLLMTNTVVWWPAAPTPTGPVVVP